jgi:hypothetical protein
MSSFVDASVFCGAWPFRALRCRSASELKSRLAANGVTQAWVSATEAIRASNAEKLLDSQSAISSAESGAA